MLEKIKSLGADTLIYGISTIVGRFVGFLLVPIYTHALAPNQYGIVAIIFTYIAFLNIIYTYGMESSYFRFASKLESGDAKEKFSTSFISLLITSIFFSLILVIFSKYFADVIQIDNSEMILIASAVIFFDTISILPFAALRLERKSKIFVAIKLVNIFSNVIFNLYTLFVLNLGVMGILYSSLASTVLTFVLLLPEVIKNFELKFSKSLYIDLLKFGLPYIPVGLSGIGLQLIDRIILKSMIGDSAVGIYQASFRLGFIMNLFTLMFEYAWRPFYLNHAKDLEAKKIFARILTYYLLIAFSILVFFTIFIKDLVAIEVFGRTIISNKYWNGLEIVPIVMFGFLFLGCGMNFNAGIQIMKKTHSLIWISLLSILISVVCNFVLIPIFGLVGSALSFLIGAIVSCCGMYYISQKYYPIKYEYLRISKLFLSVILPLYLFYNFAVENIIFKILILFIWIVLLYVLKIFEKEEKDIIKNILT